MNAVSGSYSKDSSLDPKIDMSQDDSYPDTGLCLLSSLYIKLDPRTISSFEKSLSLSRIRLFPESLSVIDSIQLPPEYESVLALERSRVLISQWSLKDAWLVLESAERSSIYAIEKGLKFLLRASIAKLSILSHGLFIKAVESLKEIRRWLDGVTVDRYTDLQVRHLGRRMFNSSEFSILMS